MLLGFVGLLAGFFIAFDYFIKWEPRLEKMRGFINKYGKYLGMVAIFVGVWKFFGPDLTVKPINYIQEAMGPALAFEPQPFIGDLFPALFAFIGGVVLAPEIFQIFSMDEKKKTRIRENLERFKLILGLGNIFLGIIHMLVPGATLF